MLHTKQHRQEQQEPKEEQQPTSLFLIPQPRNRPSGTDSVPNHPEQQHKQERSLFFIPRIPSPTSASTSTTTDKDMISKKKNHHHTMMMDPQTSLTSVTTADLTTDDSEQPPSLMEESESSMIPATEPTEATEATEAEPKVESTAGDMPALIEQLEEACNVLEESQTSLDLILQQDSTDAAATTATSPSVSTDQAMAPPRRKSSIKEGSSMSFTTWIEKEMPDLVQQAKKDFKFDSEETLPKLEQQEEQLGESHTSLDIILDAATTAATGGNGTKTTPSIVTDGAVAPPKVTLIVVQDEEGGDDNMPPLDDVADDDDDMPPLDDVVDHDMPPLDDVVDHDDDMPPLDGRRTPSIPRDGAMAPLPKAVATEEVQDDDEMPPLDDMMMMLQDSMPALMDHSHSVLAVEEPPSILPPILDIVGDNAGMTPVEESATVQRRISNTSIMSLEDDHDNNDAQDEEGPQMDEDAASCGMPCTIGNDGDEIPHTVETPTTSVVLERRPKEVPPPFNLSDSITVAAADTGDAVAQPKKTRPSRTKSLRSALFGNSKRPSRVKSADANTLKKRMGLLALNDGSNTSTTYDCDDDLDGDDNDMDSSSRRHSAGVALLPDTLVRGGARRPSRSRTSDARVNNNGKKATEKHLPSRSKSGLRRNSNKTENSNESTGSGTTNALERMRGMMRRKSSKEEPEQPTEAETEAPKSTRTVRRIRTGDLRIVKDHEAVTERHPVRRNNTADARPSTTPPKRSFSSKAMFTRAIPKRGTSSKAVPKRTSSSKVTAPKRTSSSKGPARTLSSSRSTPKRHSSMRGPTTHLNIFGSDMVSSDFILQQLDELEANTDIVCVELEDCLVARRNNNPQEIPLRLRDILANEIRPWEGIHFVDEVPIDGYKAYKAFKRGRRQFLKAMDGICAQQVIPVVYKTKIHLTVDEAGEVDGGRTIVDMIQHEFPKDTSVVCLNLTCHETPSLQLVQALTRLLQREDRVWEEVSLQVLSDDTLPPSKLQAAAQRLQQVVKEREIEWRSNIPVQ